MARRLNLLRALVLRLQFGKRSPVRRPRPGCALQRSAPAAEVAAAPRSCVSTCAEADLFHISSSPLAFPNTTRSGHQHAAELRLNFGWSQRWLRQPEVNVIALDGGEVVGEAVEVGHRISTRPKPYSAFSRLNEAVSTWRISSGYTCATR